MSPSVDVRPHPVRRKAVLDRLCRCRARPGRVYSGTLYYLEPFVLIRFTVCWCVLQSILAYIKEAMGGKRPRRLATNALAVPESTSPARDRDLRTRKPRMSQTRHDRSKRSSDRPRSPKSPRARLSGSGSRSTVTSSSPSQGPEAPSSEQPEQQRPGRSRRRRSQVPTHEMVSSVYGLRNEAAC